MSFDSITILLALGIALFPTMILCGFFFWRFRRFLTRDLLVDAISLGIIAATFSVCFGIIALQLAIKLDDLVWMAFGGAFAGAAIPEELAKLLVIWALLRRHEDCEGPQSIFAVGILVGLGFAAFENVIYVFQGAEQWLATGMVRGMMAVPLHTACGIVLGWFFAKAHAQRAWRMPLLACGTGLAIILHGSYNWPLFYLEYFGHAESLEPTGIVLGNLGLIAAVTITAIATILAAPNNIEFVRASSIVVRTRTTYNSFSFVSYGFVLAGLLMGLLGLIVSLALGWQDILSIHPNLHVPAFGFLPLAFGVIILRGMKNEADSASALSAS